MIAYILKSSLGLLLLFGLYWILLRKEKLFIFNRYFLLFSIVFSMMIPYISIPLNTQNSEVNTNIFTVLNSNISSFSLEQNVINDVTDQSPNEESFSAEVLPFRISLTHILLLLYVSGFLILLFRFLRNIYFIAQQVRYSEKVVYSEKRLVLIEDLINPYCFYNTIFVNKNDYLKRRIGIELLEHELEHINQRHTIDIVILELIRIIYWFNPILFFYSKAIRVNHEYLADNGAIRKFPDIKSYALELINFTSCKRNISLTSGFNHSLTKRRLIMLTKSKSKGIISKSRIIITLTLALIIASLISLKESKSQSLTSSARHDNAMGTFIINDDSVNANSPSLNLIHKSLSITDQEVTYTASGLIKRDSINKTFILIGNAVVKFGEITIKADSIVLNMKTSQLFATGRKDSSGEITGTPIMKEGSKELEADEITYNLASHKGLAKNIKTIVIAAPGDSSATASEKPELFPIKKGEYTEIPEPFGYRNIHPIAKDEIIHSGIDIKTKAGTEVMATAGGKVIKAELDEKGYGKYIVIDHGEGYQSLYAHLKDYIVKSGDSVTKGQTIGHVGSTGLSTGPHLHFEISSKGVRVNPMKYLK